MLRKVVEMLIPQSRWREVHSNPPKKTSSKVKFIANLFEIEIIKEQQTSRRG
jgi:hypothetical protein